MNVADELAHEELGKQFGCAVHRHAFMLPSAKDMLQRRARARGSPLEEAAGEFAVAHAACDHDTHQGDRFGIEEMRVEGAGDAMKDGCAVASRFHCLAHDFIAGGGVFEDRRFEQAVLVAEEFIARRQRAAGTLHDVAERGVLVPPLDEEGSRRFDDRAAAAIEAAAFGYAHHADTLIIRLGL